MIIEVKSLQRKEQNYIRNLQERKHIRKIVADNGYVCYDTDDVAEYLRTRKYGRPPNLD